MSLATLFRLGGCWGRFLGLVRPSECRPGGESRAARRERRRSAHCFRPALQPGTCLEPRSLLSAAVVPGAAALKSSVHPSVGSGSVGAVQGTVIQQPDATIVLPPQLQPGRKYPLVVAFSYNGHPTGDQYTALTLWQTLGPETGVIVYASKLYYNGEFAGPPSFLARSTLAIKGALDAAIAKYPVDPSRIILTGLSGGGNYAEYFNLKYPGFAAAVFDNSGRIPFERFNRATLPTAQSFGDSRRVAVFLASPSDSSFYSDAVHSSLPYYRSLGWQTRFYSFPGGHKFAPVAVYINAIQWMESLPSWQ
jgi:predicted esterase